MPENNLIFLYFLGGVWISKFSAKGSRLNYIKMSEKLEVFLWKTSKIKNQKTRTDEYTATCITKEYYLKSSHK